MRKLTVFLAVLLCLSFSAAMAQNELVNGDFETGDFTGWTKTGTFDIMNNGDWSVPSYDGAKYAGFITSYGSNQTGNIVQWADETQFPGWDPNGTGKLITIGGAAFLHARHFGSTWENVWVDIAIDYLDAGGNEVLVPIATLSNVDTENELAWFPFEYQYMIQGYQPEMVSAHFTIRNKDGMEWSYAFVDGLYLTGECVPEPSSMLALGTGLMGLVGFAIRRRR